ncbi:MAG TPA: YkgJ family cysteine cluster protein [Thermodesulfovibrionales bacterium]|nr:YkgJ family cysteine cluster protein [Thermodesulfovibrionales bacterium]
MSRFQGMEKERDTRRAHFLEESKFPWLSMLLDAYAIIDEGVAKAVQESEKNNALLACKKGCDNCCRTHTDIPLYPLEMVGVYWYCTEKMATLLRELLRTQLKLHRAGDPCPFLIHGSCSIHTIRPVACRQFNVFNKPCGVGEDPYFTRRDDVLIPIREYTERAFSTMLPYYGTANKGDRQKAIAHIIHTQAVNLQSFDWKKLVRLMDDFDSR